MTSAKKAWGLVHLKSSIDAPAPSAVGYDGGKSGAAATNMDEAQRLVDEQSVRKEGSVKRSWPQHPSTTPDL